MKWNVTARFGCFVDCDMEYEVEADTREEAIEIARQDAEDDLSFEAERIEEDD